MYSDDNPKIKNKVNKYEVHLQENKIISQQSPFNKKGKDIIDKENIFLNIPYSKEFVYP